jgi:hypothetical protein
MLLSAVQKVLQGILGGRLSTSCVLGIVAYRIRTQDFSKEPASKKPASKKPQRSRIHRESHNSLEES